jgi:hypothetical protein
LTEVCGAKSKTGTGLCQAQPVRPGGKCRGCGGASTGPRTAEGKARLAACAAVTAKKRWEDKKASGDGSRLGPLSEEGRAALRAFNAGRKYSRETRSKMREAHRQVEAGKRGTRYRERIAEHGAMLASVFQDQRGSDVR